MKPTPIASVGPAEKIVVAHESACALLRTGDISCWRMPFDRFAYLPMGRESEDLVQPLPRPSAFPERSTREPVPPQVQAAFGPASDLVQIEVGVSLACALFEDGAVQCLATNPADTPRSAADFPTTATKVEGLSARALSVDGAACAITRDDRVVCWGFIARTAQFPACAPTN